MNKSQRAQKYGLYDCRFEHDACGVGFVCDINGKKSNHTVVSGLEVLKRLSHRGSTGADPQTGDGAGILIQIPHEFFVKVCPESGIKIPAAGDYAVGMVFLPVDHNEREFCRNIFPRLIKEQGLVLLGWRKVPVNPGSIGVAARQAQPAIEQLFIASGKQIREQLSFERSLYIIRKKAENAVRNCGLKQKSSFYITNISSRTLSYKGLFMPCQVDKFFLDLQDKDVKSALSLVHSRYSTNTFPAWDLSQPFRFLAHNGEINTLRGNINWMQARQGLLKHAGFGAQLKDLYPVIVPGGSDSAAIDNVFELLTLSGRPLAHTMMMLIPAAWQKDAFMDEKIRDFYRYHACMMEPWDGPAAIAFTDGTSIGAVLDRNGLRPARYIVTKDNMVVMASEVGVLDVPAENIKVSGRLEPGKMFYIDTYQGRIIEDKEIKESIAGSRPYGEWLRKNLVEFKDVQQKKTPGRKAPMPQAECLQLLKAFGYSREDLKVILKPMAENGQEPVGSMGNDTPLAVLSQRPQLLYNYFKQLFAQVTNPAIDPIREELVMSLDSYIGAEKNLLDETPLHCHKVRIENPLLSNEELSGIRAIRANGFRAKAISTLFKADSEKDFIHALERISKEAALAIKQGFHFIILSDRGVNKEYAALPALLACSTVHQSLVQKSLRTQLGIILETAEPREVHHFGLLFGFGADCVNPYLAFDAIGFLAQEGALNVDIKEALKNYTKAVNKGILKILSKMGISTLQSYRGAQIFEAVGLNEDVITRCFAGTVSRIAGADFNTLYKETVMRHFDAFPKRAVNRETQLSTGGVYQWKKDGEFHLWNPDSISSLQDAVWNQDYNKYKEFAALINDQSANPVTLRSLLKFSVAGGSASGGKIKPIPIDEVEPVSEITKRFATGAMSFGSISKEAHETIAIAMNRLGGRSNCGEGGEDPERYIPLPNNDSRRSRVKQVASGRFGVNINYLINADELQIKIAQGAKPGEGGQLPGHKVSAIIAKTRYTTPGVTLISPPPHHDIYSIEDLAQLIFDLKNANPKARISVKLVSEAGVGTVAAGVAKGHADMILISGGDGGTGASPLSSIKNAGLPWELGLSEAHQTLVLNNLRSRVRLQTDGQIRTGRDMAIAALLGAEEFGACSAILVTLGCVMLRHCHLNNCSVGVATQEDVLRQRFKGKPEYVVNYFTFMARELREIMAGLGIRKLDDMIGRTDLLEVNHSILPWKAEKIDFSRILFRPAPGREVEIPRAIKQGNDINGVLDLKLISLAGESINNNKPSLIELAVNNTDRAVGAMLSGHLCAKKGEQGLAPDTLTCRFKGVAGQSFGAFLAKGITFELEGMANDYVGKGISGGKIVIFPDKKSDFKPEENILIGNTTFYGAISGQAYIRGKAGERFCIRNSGLTAVVEGVGDHGCEYMTGGTVVVIGRTGRNFGAGMSGGIAYIYDIDSNFRNKCNTDMVALEAVTPEDAEKLRMLLSSHLRYTKSRVAERILSGFEKNLKKFIKVMPIEYKRVLDAKEAEIKLDLSEVSDG